MSERLPCATHCGELVIADLRLACFVLEDGVRLLGADDLLCAFGSPRPSRTGTDDGRLPPALLSKKNLQPFICDSLRKACIPVRFRTEDGDFLFGYRAQVLPRVCNLYLSVRDAGKLYTGQKALALRAYRLVRELATLGIHAWVDAASNYRELCHSPAVEGLLERYLKPYAARWSKRFPDEYYQEIYRLKGWEWPGMGVNRLPITGHITNEIVYARLADGLLDRLRLENPKKEDGERDHRHHQRLSDDFGVQELREHLVGVIAIMRTVVDPDPKRAWQKFYISLQRAYPRKHTNYHFDFDEEN